MKITAASFRLERGMKGMLGYRSRSWLGTGNGGFALARSIPTISDTALIQYLAQARRELRARPARELLATLPAEKARFCI